MVVIGRVFVAEEEEDGWVVVAVAMLAAGLLRLCALNAARYFLPSSTAESLRGVRDLRALLLLLVVVEMACVKGFSLGESARLVAMCEVRVVPSTVELLADIAAPASAPVRPAASAGVFCSTFSFVCLPPFSQRPWCQEWLEETKPLEDSRPSHRRDCMALAPHVAWPLCSGR